MERKCLKFGEKVKELVDGNIVSLAQCNKMCVTLLSLFLKTQLYKANHSVPLNRGYSLVLSP